MPHGFTQTQNHVADAPQFANALTKRNDSRKWRGSLGWAAYFPGENENDEACNARACIVRKLHRYFMTSHGQDVLDAVDFSRHELSLDYMEMVNGNAHGSLRSAGRALREKPDEILGCIGLAATRAMEEIGDLPEKMMSVVDKSVRIIPRVYGFDPLVKLRGLKGSSVGKFVAIRGTVVRVSNMRQQVLGMQFECGKCSAVFSRRFPDYKYCPPEPGFKCPTSRCRSKVFNPKRDSADTVDWQKIRVQEILNEEADAVREEGRMPRTIDVELFSSLIDSCVPGDTIVVCGTVRVLNLEAEGGRGGGRKQNQRCLYYLYMEGNSIANSRKPEGVGEAFSQPDFEIFRAVISKKDPFAFLVNSAVPSIYGHELVKAGLLLSLLGGTPKTNIAGGNDAVNIRSDIHCLLVGDPGLGKSQMLKAISNIGPRGVYICGNTSTTAGLTVTVVRESSGDFALEAGALVLGDRGVCCIDEFDKMGVEHGALLEAMEQQSVSVAKAGMICNLSARTSVIAAANPAGGHYNRAKTVCENLKMSLPLLSRFDLVFILVDKPDMARDRFISEHIMAMFGMRSSTRRHTSNNQYGRNQNNNRNQGSAGYANIAAQQQNVSTDGDRVTLLERLQSSKVYEPLLPSMFRKYIAYARMFVKPCLSEGAKRVIQEFYLTLRRGAKAEAIDSTPITTRQLESLVRLSEARARSCLREVVTEDDALDVIEVMRESMLDEFMGEDGMIDLGRATGMSRSKEKRQFVAALEAEASRTNSPMFTKADLKRVAESIGINMTDFDGLLDSINHQGFMLKKGPRSWQLQSSSVALQTQRQQYRTQFNSRRRTQRGGRTQRTAPSRGRNPRGSLSRPREGDSSSEYSE